jgi:hypothetical protein
MWHYQVVQYKHGIGIVEAITVGDYKVVDGKIRFGRKKTTLYTDNLLTDSYEDVADLEHSLKLMLKDIKKYKPITEKQAFKKKRVDNRK